MVSVFISTEEISIFNLHIELTWATGDNRKIDNYKGSYYSEVYSKLFLSAERFKLTQRHSHIRCLDKYIILCGLGK